LFPVEESVLTATGRPKIELIWKSDSELLVRHGPGRIFKKLDTSNGVKIAYDPIEWVERSARNESRCQALNTAQGSESIRR